jgi:biotin-[acetyl-CoA-carboxylase] ligase BirA-like protein
VILNEKRCEKLDSDFSMIIPSKIYRKERCADTFAWAKEFIHEAPDGSVFLADFLDRARGRQSRAWMFYEGQLAVTLLLKPRAKAFVYDDDRALRFNYFSMAISLGILDPIKKYGIKLKWPNDFIFEGKKLGGVLSELIWKGDVPYAIIVGFALNINNIFDPSDPLLSTAISLHAITDAQHDLQELLHQILASLDQWYQCWLCEDFESIYHDWKAQRISGEVLDFLLGGDLVLKNEEHQRLILPFYTVKEVEVE